MYEPYVFYVNGMTCVSCSSSIESMLRTTYTTNFKSFQVDIAAPDPKKVTVQLGITGQNHQKLWQEIANNINDIGYDCEAYDYAKKLEDASAKDQPQTLSQRILTLIKSHWFLGALGVLGGIALLVGTLVVGHIPLGVMIALGVISGLLTLALGARSYYEAGLKLFKSGTLTMDLLLAISSIAVLGVSIASFFVPWLPMMFETGLLIYGFRHVGLAIEETLKHKITPATFKERADKYVIRIENGVEKTVALDKINPGDLIIIYPAKETEKIIPIDGVCEQTCSIFDTIITGSTIPRSYLIGEKIFAGMRLAPGTVPLQLRVTKPSAKSYLAKLDNNIAQALLTKAPIEITANKILSYFIPAVICLALISGIVVSIFFSPALAIQCALSVLVSACPCTLGAIVPWAVKTGINKAAENGVQFKDADAVHRAASINVVVIDLHGTLTTGIPTISDFKALDDSGISQQELLNLACTLEKQSPHPVGKAVLAFAQEHGGKESTINLTKKLHHAGECGLINEEEYFIGSSSLMHDQGIDTQAITQGLNLAAGDSLVYVARKGKVLGYFIVTQALRKDAKTSIDALKAMGKQVHLCTGADEDTARRYAKILSIDTVHAACVGTTSTSSTKNSKPAYIQSLINQGYKVAMVGDGDNDAHAIATSTFSIAVASKNGDEITQQKAGAVIQSNSLLAIVSAFTIAEQTAANIKQNLLMSFTYNTGAVLLACGVLLVIGFAINPAVGAALMGIQACLILLNVYRFKHQSLPHLEKAKTESNVVEQDSNQKIHGLLPKVGSVIDPKNAAPCTQNVGSLTQATKLFPSPSERRCHDVMDKGSTSFDYGLSKISVL